MFMKLFAMEIAMSVFGLLRLFQCRAQGQVAPLPQAGIPELTNECPRVWGQRLPACGLWVGSGKSQNEHM